MLSCYQQVNYESLNAWRSHEVLRRNVIFVGVQGKVKYLFSIPRVPLCNGQLQLQPLDRLRIVRLPKALTFLENSYYSSVGLLQSYLQNTETLNSTMEQINQLNFNCTTSDSKIAISRDIILYPHSQKHILCCSQTLEGYYSVASLHQFFEIFVFFFFLP